MIKFTKRARDRESELILELQRDHGYMLASMPREADRLTTQVRKIGSKMTMTPARVIRLIVPDDSALGRAISRAKTSDRRRTK